MWPISFFPKLLYWFQLLVLYVIWPHFQGLKAMLSKESYKKENRMNIKWEVIEWRQYKRPCQTTPPYQWANDERNDTGYPVQWHGYEKFCNYWGPKFKLWHGVPCCLACLCCVDEATSVIYLMRRFQHLIGHVLITFWKIIFWRRKFK